MNIELLFCINGKKDEELSLNHLQQIHIFRRQNEL
jgi:hypothetical protein